MGVGKGAAASKKATDGLLFYRVMVLCSLPCGHCFLLWLPLVLGFMVVFP